jgi:MraZ protein
LPAIFRLTSLILFYKRDQSGEKWGKEENKGVAWGNMAIDSTQAAEYRFRSRSEHNLDTKGRLNIPSRFREVLRHEFSENLIVTNWHHCLKAYPLPVWEHLEAILLGEGKKQAGMAPFVRYIISGVTECALDKQGRILVPPALRADFNITKEVVLNGMLDHFEIWSKAGWEAETKQTREKFPTFDLSALGIL